MSTSFGSLGDLFPESEVPCRVHGCKNMVHISGTRAMYSKTVEHGRNSTPMCDECYAYFQTLEDKEMPCSKPGCDGKWIWTRWQQLEAHARAHGHEPRPPQGLCPKCIEELKEVEAKQIPCRVRGCKNTWNWTAKMQLESKDGKPPRRLCDDCFRTLNSLEDKELDCCIKGCDHKVTWTRFQQLEYIRSGGDVAKPPQRMCERCLTLYHELKPVEVNCRVSGCKGTWLYTPREQVEARIAAPEGQEPAVPKRMCKSCFQFFQNSKDIEQPCANRGCDGKWIWTRAMQLGGHVHGHDHAPHRMCDDCQKRLKELQPIEQPCQEAACKGTWTYTPEEQLKDALLKRQPAPRHCAACKEFLASHQSELVKCEKCGGEFAWSAQEQLLTSLGAFQKPSVCAKCNSESLAEMPPPPQLVTPAPIKPLTVTIPTGGPWNDSPVTRDWPQGMTADLIERMEHATRRVVCIGDEMTLPPEDSSTPGWTALLERRLREKQPGTVLLQSGLAGCTTDLACARFERDVAPFAPHLLIFSFAFADSRKMPADASAEAYAAALQPLEEAFQRFVGLARALPQPPELLAWLPNPIYPQEGGRNDLWHDNPAPDAEAVRWYDAVLRALRSWCQKAEVPVLDAKAMFEMVGQKSALAWMATWNRPNADGLKNLANWFADKLGNP